MDNVCALLQGVTQAFGLHLCIVMAQAAKSVKELPLLQLSSTNPDIGFKNLSCFLCILLQMNFACHHCICVHINRVNSSPMPCQTPSPSQPSYCLNFKVVHPLQRVAVNLPGIQTSSPKKEFWSAVIIIVPFSKSKSYSNT
jgi:hypothetical protein